MPKNTKHINFLILTFALVLFTLSTNAQEVRVIDNKGTIQNINNNRVFTQATDPNPTLPTPPITVQGDIWFNSSVTPNEMNVWNGTSWVTVSTQNNAWLRANSTDIPNDINDNIYTNGRIGINDDNPDYAIKVITQSEGIDQFLRFETDDSDDFLEISNTTGATGTLSGGFIGGSRAANRSSLNFFGDSEIVDDLNTSQPIVKFFARRGSNNSSAFGGAAEAVTNRPLFDFLNGDTDSKLRILANGNTGIDVDTPTEKLDINGKLRIRDISTVTTNNDILTTDANGVVQKKVLVDTQANNSITNGANGGVYYNSPIKAMGKIYADGSVAKITTGYTVTKGITGRYQINIPAAQQTDANYIIQLTPFGVGNGNDDYTVATYYGQTISGFSVEIKNYRGVRVNNQFMFTILNF